MIENNYEILVYLPVFPTSEFHGSLTLENQLLVCSHILLTSNEIKESKDSSFKTYERKMIVGHQWKNRNRRMVACVCSSKTKTEYWKVQRSSIHMISSFLFCVFSSVGRFLYPCVLKQASLYCLSCSLSDVLSLAYFWLLEHTCIVSLHISTNM